MRGGMASWVRMGLLALLWGSAFLWIKLALRGFSPIEVSVIRAVLGTVVLLVLARVAGQPLPRDARTWGHLVVAAFFCNALPFVLFGIGEQTVDSGVAGVLHATTPLWSVVIGYLTGTERGPRPVRVIGLVLGFLGVMVIFAPWRAGGLASWGAVVLLAAAASYAGAFAYMARHLTGRGNGPTALSAAQLGVASGLSALGLPFDGGTAGPVTWVPVVAVVMLGVFATGFTFALNYRLIADEGATNTAVVGYLLPVVSVALGAAVLGEDMNVRIVAGMVVVLVGVALTRRDAGATAPNPRLVPGRALKVKPITPRPAGSDHAGTGVTPTCYNGQSS